MIKILFVCHGNICRSPMAEFIFKDLIEKQKVSKLFSVASAATSSEEIGNPVYPPAKAQMRKRGIGGFENKRAVKLKRSDYELYDYFVGMDYENIYNMKRLFDGDKENKVKLLLDYTSTGGEVSDPWYTDNFEKAFDDIERGSKAFLGYLLKNKK